MTSHNGPVISGHKNDRRVIWDIITSGNAGGGERLHQLSFFAPVFPGAQIGGAKRGMGHYHKKMYETYIILSGLCTLSLMDVLDGTIQHLNINIKQGEAPWKVEIPPQFAHRLVATSETMLLIAATGTQCPEDTFEVELPVPRD